MNNGATGMGSRNVNVMPIETLWTVRDVAAFLKASTSWVYKAAERGELPCLRLGAMLRFDPDALRRFVLGCPGPAPSPATAVAGN